MTGMETPRFHVDNHFGAGGAKGEVGAGGKVDALVEHFVSGAAF